MLCSLCCDRNYLNHLVHVHVNYTISILLGMQTLILLIYSGYGKMYYDHIQLPLVASKHKNVTKNIGFFV